MTAPKRPTLQSSRRTNWRAFLLQEWSLLLLAAALTLLIWFIVREKVIGEHVLTDVQVRVRIEDEDRDRLAAVLTGDRTVDVTLRCSVPEKEEIEEQLRKDGWRVDLLVRTLEGNSRRLIPELDHYLWKFADERVLAKVVPEVPPGQVLRVGPRRLPVRLPEPATNPATTVLEEEHGLRADISIEPAVVAVTLPVDAPADPLTADPIDLRRLLGSSELRVDRPLVLDLTFETWRGETSTPIPRAYRRDMVIPAVKAQVKLEQIHVRDITNTLVVQLAQEKYEYEFHKRKEVDGISPTADLTFTGKLRGPKAVIDQLETDARAGRLTWVWGVRIKQPEKLPPQPGPDEEPTFEELRAEIVFVPLKGYSDRGVRFEPLPIQQEFDLRVRWHREHK